MKKTVIFLMIISISISSYIYCLAEPIKAAASEVYSRYFYDLEQLDSIETQSTLESMVAYLEAMENILKLQKEAINSMGSLYYMGYTYGAFDGIRLREALDWKKDGFKDSSLLFETDYFKNYCNYRMTALKAGDIKPLSSEINKFIALSEEEYSAFLKTDIASLVHYDRLMLLLQDKVLENIHDIDSSDLDAFAVKVLSLRLKENEADQYEYIYQLFESRVRIKFVEEIIENNIQTITQMAKNINVWLTSSKEGELRRIPANVLYKQNSGVPLEFLINIGSIQIKLKSEESIEYDIPTDFFCRSITKDAEGYLTLDIDEVIKSYISYQTEMLSEEQPEQQIDKKKAENMDLQLKQFGKSAGEIVKELNRYDIYKQLADKNIDNTYTQDFLINKEQWEANLKSMLSNFDMQEEQKSYGNGYETGSFLRFINSYSQLDRSEKSLEDRRLILNFRQSVLQFRAVEEANLWLLDILYKLIFNQ